MTASKDPFITYAEFLAKIGISLQWLPPQSKIPTEKAWQKLPYQSAEQIRAAYQSPKSLSIRTGTTSNPSLPLVVVDLDNEQAITWANHHLPETPIRSKTFRGEHWYYRHPGPPRGVPSRKYAHLHIDIKGDGGHVVCPPSTHVTGTTKYEPMGNWFDESAWKSLPVFELDWFHAEGSPLLKRAISYLAKLPPAISGEGGHQALWKAALTLVKGFELPEEEALRMLKEHYNPLCDPPWSDKDLWHKVQDAQRASVPIGYLKKEDPDPSFSSSKSAKHNKGEDEKTILALAHLLQYDRAWSGVIRYNEFADQIEFAKAPPWHPEYAPPGQDYTGIVKDVDASRLICWLEKTQDITISRNKAFDAMTLAAYANPYHPVREYLRSLTWDGVERLPEWLPVFCQAPDSPYVRKVGAWWMIAAVARILEPGCLVRSLLILEGAQGSGKSSVCQVLGGPYHRDTSLSVGEKDSFASLRGAWIYELAEIDALSRYEASQIKQYISSSQDWYRPAYARFNQLFKRQCVFIGTTNKQKSSYLNDDTGGTRFWPVETGHIDLDGLQRARDQLFAEAVVRYQRGEPWWPTTREEAQLCTKEQEERYGGDPWEETVAGFLKHAPVAVHAQIKQGQLTTDLMLQQGLGLSPKEMTRAAQTRLGIVMSRLGWIRKRRLDSETKERVSVYLNPSLYPEHVNV